MPDTDVTIEVFAANAHLSPEFIRALGATTDDQSKLVYKGTMFHIVREGGQISAAKVILAGANAALPPVFEDELRVNFVVLRSTVPADIQAATGWYVGANFGLPGAACCIDPKGERNQGVPQIYANGDDFASVVTLFLSVMEGRMTPGDENDRWSGTVRR